MSQLSAQEEAAAEKTKFGFWMYLMTDCVLFAALFATYAVLHKSTFDGPGAGELFNLPYALTETLLLLTSSFTAGLAVVGLRHGNRTATLWMLAITFALGAAFLGMELHEFINFAHEGNSWQRSGFLSAFFTLVGTHGAHITAGLIWLVVMMVQLSRRGITTHTTRRLGLFGMFWHFLDIIWIFIFTIVYLMGVANG